MEASKEWGVPLLGAAFGDPRNPNMSYSLSSLQVGLYRELYRGPLLGILMGMLGV